MIRTSIKAGLNDTLKNKINNISEELFVDFDITSISMTGDILEFDRDIDKPLLYIEISDMESWTDMSNNEIFKNIEKQMNSEFKDFSFRITNEPCRSQKEELNVFFDNNKQNRFDLLKNDTNSNLFNDENVKNLFANLAENQRGKPESAMRAAQMFMGGGEMSLLLEHIGDLTHRMCEKMCLKDPNIGMGRVSEKTNNGLKTLNASHDFDVDFNNNLSNNFNYGLKNNKMYPWKTFEKFEKEINKFLKEYSRSHSELVVYNKIQHAAKYAAVHLGNRDFKETIKCLNIIKNSIDDNTYFTEVSQCTDNYEMSNLELFKNKIKSKYKNELKQISFTYDKYKNSYVLDNIKINEEFRNKGIGTEIVKDCVAFSKLQGANIYLIPSTDRAYGTKSKAKLFSFYKNIGFKHNSGVNKDQEFPNTSFYIDFLTEKKKHNKKPF